MKILYLECNMGAAGDMLMAALAELIPDKAAFIQKMNALGLPGVTVALEPSVKCGITGSHISVAVRGEEETSADTDASGQDSDSAPEQPKPDSKHKHSHDTLRHHHRHSHHSSERKPDLAKRVYYGLAANTSPAPLSIPDAPNEAPHTHPESRHSHRGVSDIVAIIRELPVSDKVKADALDVYRLVADAESTVHGVPVDQIHFHEVGNLDAIADIVGVSMLMDELKPDFVYASPVHVGSGQVKSAHGILPVPAPATAHILRGVPVYGGSIQGELCTPTGAALLKHFVSDFRAMPDISAEAIGYGMGNKDFEAANCVRAIFGEAAQSIRETVSELACNLDDMTPEAIAFAGDMLLAEGALDVWTVPIGMKKSRPAVLLTCLCKTQDADAMAALMLRHTTTLGVRETVCRRWTLEREETVRDTAFGQIRFKTARGEGFARSKPEYEDVARAARESGLSFGEVLEKL